MDRWADGGRAGAWASHHINIGTATRRALRSSVVSSRLFLLARTDAPGQPSANSQPKKGVRKQELTGILRIGRLVLLLHADERHGDLLEEALDVMSRLGGRLHEHDVELRRLLVCFF